MLCGARITLSYMRPGGVFQDAPEDFWPSLDSLIGDLPHYFDELESLITSNEIVLARTKNVGLLTDEQAIDNSMSGPNLRASGVKWDLRKADPYEIYDRVKFEVPIGAIGDTFDRYLVRILEMRESVKIIEQCLEQIESGPIRANTPFFIRPPAGEAYAAVEGPKGELGGRHRRGSLKKMYLAVARAAALVLALWMRWLTYNPLTLQRPRIV